MHVCPQCGDSAGEPGECARDQVPMLSAEGDEHLGLRVGSYRIARLLGTGGMGRVYLAVHPDIGSRVAIKIFSRDWDTRADLVDRFFAEARATNLIRHESIINVLDVNRLESGRPYMVMEHLRGLPLSKLIETRKLTDSGILHIMLDVLGGLDAAHSHQIIHRDLKPDNIFVSPEGNATLLDFGVAKLVPELLGDSGPTTTGAILGTPHYMSPEQAVGDPVDVRTDVYALGIILYECFTLHRPFDASSLYKLLDQHVHKEPRPPRSLRPELSVEIEEIILRALSKKPGDRYQTAAEMRTALESCDLARNPSLSMRIRLDTADEDEHALAPSPISDPTVDEADTDEDAESITVATVASNPRNRAEDNERAGPEAKGEGRANERAKSEVKGDVREGHQEHSFGFWLVGSGLAMVAVVWLFIAYGTRETHRPPDRGRFGNVAVAMAMGDAGPGAGNAGSAVLSEPSPTAGTVPTHPDAAIAIPDAGVLDAAPAVKQRKRGVAPFSLYPAARKAAASLAKDAMLSRVQIDGINSHGRVELGKKGAMIQYVFLSPALVRDFMRRPMIKASLGFCLVKVTYSSSRTPKVERLYGDCASKSIIPPPDCSVAELIKKAVRLGQVNAPKENSTISLGYRETITKLSSSITWRLAVDERRGRSINGCD